MSDTHYNTDTYDYFKLYDFFLIIHVTVMSMFVYVIHSFPSMLVFFILQTPLTSEWLKKPHDH